MKEFNFQVNESKNITEKIFEASNGAIGKDIVHEIIADKIVEGKLKLAFHFYFDTEMAYEEAIKKLPQKGDILKVKQMRKLLLFKEYLPCIEDRLSKYYMCTIKL